MNFTKLLFTEKVYNVGKNIVILYGRQNRIQNGLNSIPVKGSFMFLFLVNN